ncbi:DUF1465 family protein [Polycladidibacter hongkongensis]|uniref:protease adaptor protein RcdA n=1 Tax=Polycladidibacter hongkongensis TaxID=1647556 RepID=UPI00082A0826|nr:DUF1465 family protein [Pseudovibrio hongkongensis]
MIRPKKTSPSPPTYFGQHVIQSQGFEDLFQDGMALIEETASYLDGPGKKQSRSLARAPALAYASESMRLTTRLMQLASWLLLQRAVLEGEITPSEANSERRRVQFGPAMTAQNTKCWDELPTPLCILIEKATRLQERVQHLEEALVQFRRQETQAQQQSPIDEQIEKLRAELPSFSKLPPKE